MQTLSVTYSSKSVIFDGIFIFKAWRRLWDLSRTFKPLKNINNYGFSTFGTGYPCYTSARGSQQSQLPLDFLQHCQLAPQAIRLSKNLHKQGKGPSRLKSHFLKCLAASAAKYHGKRVKIADSLASLAESGFVAEHLKSVNPDLGDFGSELPHVH